MSDGNFSPFLITRWLMELAKMPAWCGLHFESPAIAVDALATEVLGDRYGRQQILWSADTPRRVLRNANAPRWPILPPGTLIVAVVVWNAAYNGEWLCWCPLPSPIELPLGGSFTLPSGELFAAIDP